MGGSKNKSPAQKEKSQKRDDAEKKGKKSNKGEDSKIVISALIDENQAMKFIKDSKVITAHELARYTSVKISTANAFLQKSYSNGIIKRIGGFSGHHIYQEISQ